MKNNKSTSQSAFTLVEVMIMAAVLSAFFVSTIFSLRAGAKAKAIMEERATMTVLADEIARTFAVEAWDQNISCITGYDAALGGQGSLTVFGAAVPLDNTGIAFRVPENFWAVKLCRGRSDYLILGDTGYTIDMSQNGTLREVAVNKFDNARILVAGPTDEVTQRYMIMSLIATPEFGLVIPAIPSDPNDFKNWFNAIWDCKWSGEAPPPALWSSLLSSGDYQHWLQSGSGGTTNCDRLLVKKIHQKKYSVTLNNNALNTEAYVRVRNSGVNLIAETTTGSFQSPLQVLSGRWIEAAGKLSGAPGSPAVLQTQMATSPVVFTLQN